MHHRSTTALWAPWFALLLGAAPLAHAGPQDDRLAGAPAALETVPLSTGVLYDRVLPLSGIERFSGGPRPPVASVRLWRQLYEELRRAAGDNADRLPAAAWFDVARRRRDAVPLAAILDDYERLRPDAVARGLALDSQGRLRGAGEILGRHTAFAAAALREWTYQGRDVAFVLAHDAWFSNLAGPPPRLEADLDDGLGYRSLQLDVPLLARYSQTGTRTLRLRATSPDGTIRHAAFTFIVRALAAPAPDDTLHVTATIPYLGSVASGEAYVYLAPGHTALLNPAVVVEGFDLDNDMNWEELHALLNQEQLLDNLRADGYDAVVLNFADATDYLQRNAFLVVELIQQLQAAISPQATLALAGASMGGLVNRYALAYMETNALPHRVRTFISFDAPQLGANIPLGIQYWMKFFSTQSADAAQLLALLDRPAARQMLVYHYTTPPGTTGQPDPLRGTFLAELAGLGDYPAQPRRVAIANGSGSGVGQGFAAGAQIIQWSYPDLIVTILGNVWAVPNVTSTKIFDGRIRILFVSDTRQAVTVNGTQPYDNAPGGSRATMTQMDTTVAPYGDILALHPAHSFIPTVSALAFDNPDLFHNILADPDPLAHTPFDVIYVPAVNQEHVAITPENATWIRSEVGLGVTGVGPPAASGLRLAVPRPNPSSGPVGVAFTLPRSGPVDLRVFGVDGREVASLARGPFRAGSHEIAWSGRDARGVAAPAGVYFVRFAAGGAVEVRRFVRLGS